MKRNKSVIYVGRGFPAKESFLTFDKQSGKEAANCWAKPNLHSNAFTLIELLVVVLIIGILAAVALPQYQVAVAKNRYVQAMILGRALYNAEKVYELANGQWTANLDALDVDLPLYDSSSKQAYVSNDKRNDYCFKGPNQEIYCYVQLAPGEQALWWGHYSEKYENRFMCQYRKANGGILAEKVCRSVCGKAVTESGTDNKTYRKCQIN